MERILCSHNALGTLNCSPDQPSERSWLDVVADEEMNNSKEAKIPA